MMTIDLTQTFNASMPVYPGDPIPELKQTAFIKEHGYNEFHLDTGMHVGTHMDAPLHMIDGGGTISQIPLQKLIGHGRLVDARNCTRITANYLDGLTINAGDIVVVHTNWHKRFHDPDYYAGFPQVDELFAARIVELGVSVLGLDTPSPDADPFPIHKILLGNGTLIVENLANLDDLLGDSQFEIIALPTKLECEGAPVRVIARTIT